MRHADFRVVEETEDTIFIEDLNLGNLSVTNDAEWVIESLVRRYGVLNKKVVYKDTTGNWDELIHDGNVFLDFGLWKGTIPNTI